MKLTKKSLEQLYETMSLAELAEHLSIARSTLYYHMKKLGVERRSKSDAQQKHLSRSDHQRKGKSHSDDAKEKISEGARRFWESENGEQQKLRLGELRKSEWNSRSKAQRSKILNRLQSAERPSPGKLSKFGIELAKFLREREDVTVGIKLTPGHVSDIILEARKVVIELLLPVSIYGNASEQKIENRYDKLIQQLNDIGYRVVMIEDRSNSISKARCQRVYDELVKFFEDDSISRIDIVS